MGRGSNFEGGGGKILTVVARKSGWAKTSVTFNRIPVDTLPVISAWVIQTFVAVNAAFAIGSYTLTSWAGAFIFHPEIHADKGIWTNNICTRIIGRTIPLQISCHG